MFLFFFLIFCKHINISSLNDFIVYDKTIVLL